MGLSNSAHTENVQGAVERTRTQRVIETPRGHHQKGYLKVFFLYIATSGYTPRNLQGEFEFLSRNLFQAVPEIFDHSQTRHSP